MTDKIANAIESNQAKFKELRLLAENLIVLKKDWEIKEEYLIKIYEIVLKNLSSKKKLVYKETKIQNRKEYFIGRDGISCKSEGWGINTANISKDNFKIGIKLADENIKEFLKIMSKEKKIKFKQFLEKSYLYYNLTPSVDKNYNEIITKTNCDEYGNFETTGVKNIKIQVGNIVKAILNGESNSYGYCNSNDYNLLKPKEKEFIIFEQLFIQIRDCLKQEVKNKEQSLTNITKYLNDLDLKFSKYIKSILMLRELRK